MADNSEILEAFAAAITDSARAEAESLRSGAERRESETVSAFEAEKRRETQRRIDAKKAKSSERTSRLINAGKLRCRHELLQFREDCAEESFSALRERLEKFARGPEYAGCLGSLLLKGLSFIPGKGAVKVYLRGADLRFADKLAAAAPDYELTFEAGNFLLGGLILISGASQRRVDLSFDSAVEDLSGRFSELTGFCVE